MDQKRSLKNGEELRRILCALQYLSGEAKQMGMKSVSDIINSSLTKIKTVVEHGNASFDDIIIHSDTVSIMQFLYAYATANEDTKTDVIKALRSMSLKQYDCN